ncbi:ScbR family autoregulator-binding transcription factor [Streptomyces sp. NPDC038707]|uniref:ScbR family autoregulator-binding transcription factor n=1 Tax=Streptomyces sp. NPDC038707 TaxID=3154329 RepID=UPI0033D30CD7
MKQERAYHTRRDLIRSAAVAFDRHGYAHATLSEISRQAGVSNGALHFHFDNKSALAAAVEAAAGETLRDTVREAYRGSRSALRVLTDISVGLLRLLRGNVVFRAGFQLSCDPAWTPQLDLRAEWHKCVQRCVDEAVKDGSLHPGIAPRDAVSTIVAATTGFGLLGREEPEWVSQATINGFWVLLLPRISAEPHSAEPGGHNRRDLPETGREFTELSQTGDHRTPSG